ncbi:MAG TPA: fumarylacetoacetate hydrolase family protein [Terracidiphilus sp.]|nr:fumarylacetoacetate hydrolase family protein [Terracidiphilus sp.]
MKLATFRTHDRTSWGIVHDRSVLDTGLVLIADYPDLKSWLARQDIAALDKAGAAAVRYEFAEMEWLPVIPNPEKIFCVGLNYEMHRVETGRAAVEHPTIFMRLPNTQTGHLTNIIRPRVSSQLDFEGELAVIIGKAGRYIPRETALGHVAGYACYNDGSIRDWQRHTHQFTPGKNFPGTGGFGPWMVTADEFAETGFHRLTTRLNSEVVQQAVLSEMIFDIPTLIHYCSSFNPLVPGDVIVTGTPGGVGAKRNPPLWMKPGDTVEVEIDGIGVLKNGIADESAS